MNQATQTRLALIKNGYQPIPTKGKRPTIDGWTEIGTADEVTVHRWEREGRGDNTGIQSKFTVGFDFDIPDESAVADCKELAASWFGGRGTTLWRVGCPPKVLMPARTDTPFPKITREFIRGDGAKARVEILCDGQQFVVDGIHPDTGEPYAWDGGRDLKSVKRDELPHTNVEDATELGDLIADLLAERHGFKLVGGAARGGSETSTVEDWRPPLDTEEMLDNIRPGMVHNTELTAMASLLSRGVHFEIALAQVMGGVRAMPESADYNWAEEQAKVEKQGLDWITKHPELADLLPEKLRGRAREIITAGGELFFYQYQGNGWVVRAKRGTANGGEPKKARFGGRPDAKAFYLEPQEPFDIHALPPRQWLYGKSYQRKRVSITGAPGGTGKSSLLMVEGVAMATGMNLLGEQADEILRVWYHCGEDDMAELRLRLAGICVQYDLDVRDILPNFIMTTHEEFPLKVARGHQEIHVDSPLLERIAEQIIERKIDVAMLDPLVTLHGVSEQDNGKMDTVIRLFAELAGYCNCSVALAQHVRKLQPGQMEYDGDDLRGASAQKDAARLVRILNTMSKSEANSLGLKDEDRFDYFRVSIAKANSSRRSGPPTWRRFAEVTVGRAELLNEEQVGVVTPWAPPNANDTSPEVEERRRLVRLAFLSMLDRFTSLGQEVNHLNHSKSAVKAFVEEPEAKAIGATKKDLDEAMRTLLRGKQIKIEETSVNSRKGCRLVRGDFDDDD